MVTATPLPLEIKIFDPISGVIDVSLFATKKTVQDWCVGRHVAVALGPGQRHLEEVLPGEPDGHLRVGVGQTVHVPLVREIMLRTEHDGVVDGGEGRNGAAGRAAGRGDHYFSSRPPRSRARRSVG